MANLYNPYDNENGNSQRKSIVDVLRSLARRASSDSSSNSDGFSSSDSGVRFDPTWSHLPSLDEARHDVSVIPWGQNRLIATGGWKRDGTWATDIGYLDFADLNQDWIALPNIPVDLGEKHCPFCYECNPKGVVVRNRLFLFEVCCNCVEDQWNVGHAGGSIDRKIYVLDLQQPEDGWECHGTWEVFDPDEYVSHRAYSCAMGSKVAFFDGHEDGTIEIYDTVQNKWRFVCPRETGEDDCGIAMTIGEQRILTLKGVWEGVDCELHLVSLEPNPQENSYSLIGGGVTPVSKTYTPTSVGFQSRSSCYLIRWCEQLGRHSCCRCDFSMSRDYERQGPFTTTQLPPAIPLQRDSLDKATLTKVGHWLVLVGGDASLGTAVRGLRIIEAPIDDDGGGVELTFLHLALRYNEIAIVPFLIDLYPFAAARKDKPGGMHPLQIALEESKNIPSRVLRQILRANVRVLPELGLKETLYPFILEALQATDGRDQYIATDSAANNIFQLVRMNPQWFQRCTKRKLAAIPSAS